MKKIFILAILFSCVAAQSAVPKIILKEGQTFAGFNLEQGKLPCKKDSPCLFFHKDNDNLRLILEGKSIRMAYKAEDKNQGPLPFPRNFRIMNRQEKADVVEDYRGFFASEFALMLQAFIYTAPEIFDWDVEDFKAVQNANLISEQELRRIFETGKAPEYYTVFRIKCAGGQTASFDSDGNGGFYLEITPASY
ncbi:MAG: hypothetical protein FWB90_02450 [Fibromonadales bacterium]|nr:hypothetical protein [Fibromonadales bacterium]